MMTRSSEESIETSEPVTERVADLTSQMVVPKEFQERYTRSLAEWSTSIEPQDEVQRFHLGQAVLASIRVGNCQIAEIQRKIVLAEIATDTGPRWDRNRQYEAKQLGTSLKRNATRIQAELERTFEGCAWLLIQWNRLVYAVPTEGESHWSQELTQEAFDLMGIAKAYRPIMLASGNLFSDPKATRTLILGQIAKLQEVQESLAPETAQLRELHRQGIGVENDANLKLIKRYEADAQRLLDRSLKTVKQAQVQKAKSQTESAPAAPAEVAPAEVAPEIKIAPTPKAETPVGNRRYRREQEASSRREAHRARQKV